MEGSIKYGKSAGIILVPSTSEDKFLIIRLYIYTVMLFTKLSVPALRLF